MDNTPLSLPMGDPQDWPEEFKGEIAEKSRDQGTTPATTRAEIEGWLAGAVETEEEFALLEDTDAAQFVTDLNALAREGFGLDSFTVSTALGGGPLFVALLSRWRPKEGKDRDADVPDLQG